MKELMNDASKLKSTIEDNVANIVEEFLPENLNPGQDQVE